MAPGVMSDLGQKVAQVAEVGGQLERVSKQIEAVNVQLGGLGDVEKSLNEARAMVAEVLEAHVVMVTELSRQRFVNLQLFKSFVPDLDPSEVDRMEAKFRDDFDRSQIPLTPDEL